MAFLPNEALPRLQTALADGRLGHAYLITSPSEETNSQFLHDLAGSILQVPPDRVDGHPNFREVRPESKSRRILIEQIRTLEAMLHQSASTAGRAKIAVIYEADRLVDAAANAFLKTLEEPQPNTHIFLLSTLPEALLGTIQSRCLEVALRPATPIEPSERELVAADLAHGLLDARHPPGLAEIFGATRKFQELLAEVKSAATDMSKATIKAEKAHYQDRTGAGAQWIETLEDKLAAQAEAEVVRERGQLLDALARVLADRLRTLAEAGDVRQGRTESLRLLRRLEALARLRANLERTLNESLALETGFMEIFLP
jgi:DNA polymerase-3 subunit delta'